ncbi:glycoside hydrolase family 9 protein [Algoriphagus zhangzhouensis]|uniref:N-terminal ig-like domain of cellulase n=1 Tax=Algoriphagus zhangzhouensis TaxID=1073327 RepID=A0A1M7ZE85_9BACT|nr:glycoside hydrolase family 9 protein [Algoriphagus zhangzhouensis]TDY45934.1 cellulase-like Ig domain-containing protein [Algoriphagus zhangzhouensis]SHO63119.1 N-terminal ig-like domain of cellulase [Algoriphagus zhangzhouensis]
MKQFLFLLTGLFLGFQAFSQEVYFSVNQIGFLPADSKKAIVFSPEKIQNNIHLIQYPDSASIIKIKPKPVESGAWGDFNYYEIDFSEIENEGEFFLWHSASETSSPIFKIGSKAYQGYQEDLLHFMRQQRCGYNPVLDMVCHEKDGRSFFGPMPDSTYVDASGGWHDAGDQLKYLITSSYATGHMLMAYTLFPDQFEDKVNALGQDGENGIPDVLDEAKWGLDWLLKLHPAPNQLIHQIADDRDHRGFKIPNQDNSDYGWGANSYRAAYFATGKPQGLMQYQSESNGMANIAGRSAAALALGARIWKEIDEAYSIRCLEAAKSLYALGRKYEGVQQGNSFGAPYRYNEETWNDDMEWAGAELFKATGEQSYRDQAKEYALISSNEDSWTVKDSASHYQLYPFINLGHFSLHEVVEPEFQKTLETFYQEGIDYTITKSKTSPFEVGIPFIWCSNNLMTSLATQLILYEKMSGDKQYQPYLTAQRDWLFGKNPWGTSMFTGIPEKGDFPVYVHTAPYVMLGLEIPGGLVDGPIFRTIHSGLIGLTLERPDDYVGRQNPFVVYHDAVGDYSTNEPTMDGTAGSIILMTYLSKN